MFKIPRGSKRSRRSSLIKTPKEARAPTAEGFSFFKIFTRSKSDFDLAWKIISRDE